MKNIAKTLLLSGLILWAGCGKDPDGNKPGSLPGTPVYLADFNTPYDDFNSTAPTLGYLIPFCFSTNRNSQGAAFDIIYQPMNVSFEKSSGILKVTNEYDNWGIYREEFEVISTGLDKIRTAGNELGPHLVLESQSNDLVFTLLYSSDVTGNARIRFISNKANGTFSEPREVAFLNSASDDLYPSFNADRSRIYFCSDRNGTDFDIFYTEVDPATDIETLLADDAPRAVFVESTLSGSSDDKCPFIFGNMMVFASDRAGGFGGFDLYYSILEDGTWSEPVNFGAKINGEYDEYRPILIDEGVTQTQAMMVFSSDRPGGEGGFDLYFVGIED